MENKFKYLGFALLVMLVGLIFIGAISAEDARVGGQLVTVPDDYDVVFENSTYLLMKNGVDHIIIMTYLWIRMQVNTWTNSSSQE